MTAVRRKPRARAPEEIVHGISLDVRGKDLAARLASRIAWHEQRQAAVRQQIEQIAQIAALDRTERDDREAVRTTVAATQRDAIRAGLERKLADHQQRKEFLAFLRDHLSPTRIYRLDSMDFRMMEIMPDSSL